MDTDRMAGDLVGDDETSAKGVVNQVAGVAQNAYGQAKDAVQQAVDAAPEFVDRASSAGQRYYEQGNRAVAGRVGEQHLVALLIAGAVGYGLGWLLHGRD